MKGLLSFCCPALFRLQYICWLVFLFQRMQLSLSFFFWGGGGPGKPHSSGFWGHGRGPLFDGPDANVLVSVERTTPLGARFGKAPCFFGKWPNTGVGVSFQNNRQMKDQPLHGAIHGVGHGCPFLEILPANSRGTQHRAPIPKSGVPQRLAYLGASLEEPRLLAGLPLGAAAIRQAAAKTSRGHERTGPWPHKPGDCSFLWNHGNFADVCPFGGLKITIWCTFGVSLWLGLCVCLSGAREDFLAQRGTSKW